MISMLSTSTLLRRIAGFCRTGGAMLVALGMAAAAHPADAQTPAMNPSRLPLSGPRGFSTAPAPTTERVAARQPTLDAPGGFSDGITGSPYAAAVQGDMLTGPMVGSPVLEEPESEMPASSAFWYSQIESLWFIREHSCQGIVPGLEFGNFDYEPGGRLTVGQHFDEVMGAELVFTGYLEWIERDRLLGANLPPPIVGVGVNTSAFNNAVQLDAFRESTMFSIEANRRDWGWGLISSVYGLRYIHFEDELALFSLSQNGTTGSFSIEDRNHLIGFQVGGDLIYPLAPWCFIAAKSKVGCFANFISQSTRLVNAGADQLITNCNSNNVDIAFLTETGAHFGVRVSEGMTIRVGYEAWGLWRMAAADDQFNPTITPVTGARIVEDEDVLIHGATGSVEFVW